MPSPSRKKMVGGRKGSLRFFMLLTTSMLLLSPARVSAAVVGTAARADEEQMEASKVDVSASLHFTVFSGSVVEMTKGFFNLGMVVALCIFLKCFYSN